MVTDPKLADAVLTDQIGEALRSSGWKRLSPPPEPAEARASRAREEKGRQGGGRGQPVLGDTVNKLDNPALHSSFGRAKGTVFLVDTKSRQVVWSAYQEPKGTTSKDLDRTANDIVSRLKHDLKGK